MFPFLSCSALAAQLTSLADESEADKADPLAHGVLLGHRVVWGDRPRGAFWKECWGGFFRGDERCPETPKASDVVGLASRGGCPTRGLRFGRPCGSQKVWEAALGLTPLPASGSQHQSRRSRRLGPTPARRKHHDPHHLLVRGQPHMKDCVVQATHRGPEPWSGPVMNGQVTGGGRGALARLAFPRGEAASCRASARRPGSTGPEPWHAAPGMGPGTSPRRDPRPAVLDALRSPQ